MAASIGLERSSFRSRRGSVVEAVDRGRRQLPRHRLIPRVPDGSVQNRTLERRQRLAGARSNTARPEPPAPATDPRVPPSTLEEAQVEPHLGNLVGECRIFGVNAIAIVSNRYDIQARRACCRAGALGSAGRVRGVVEESS